MSTHNICVYGEIRKNIYPILLLPGSYAGQFKMWLSKCPSVSCVHVGEISCDFTDTKFVCHLV